MSGQRIGFRHSEASKAKISATLSGRAPLAIHIKRECPTCGVMMGAGNLGRHAPACAAKAASGMFPGKTVKDMKSLRRRLRVYGITPEDCAALWAKQGGVCNICGGDNARRALAVDHDHDTGAVRGLLCDDCNRLLGCAGDRIAILRRAIAYLEKNGSVEPESCECPEFDPWKD
jgi:hypothetical protein